MAGSRTIPPHHLTGTKWEGFTDFQKNLKAGDLARVKYESLHCDFSYSRGYFELHNEIVQVEKIDLSLDSDYWAIVGHNVEIKGGKKLRLWDLCPATDNPFEVEVSENTSTIARFESAFDHWEERHFSFQVDVPESESRSIVIRICSLDSPENDPLICLPMKYGGDLLIHLVNDAGLEQFKQQKKVDSFLSALFYGDRSFECSLQSGIYYLIVVNFINYRKVIVNCSVEEVLARKEN